MTMLFRVNAGPKIGLGHLQRSLSLAAALKQEGTISRFLLNEEPASPAYVAQFGFSAEMLGSAASWSREDAAATVQAAARYAAQAVLVDGRDVTAAYLDQLRAAGCVVIVRDDMARFPFSCQVVVNGNADARRLPYVSSSGDTRFLLGPAYVVLREEFWSVPARAASPSVRQVLVTLGGADPQQLMPQLLRLLDDVPGDFGVTAVIGPYFEDREAIRQTAIRMQRRVRVLESPTALRERMLESDLAISGGGQTLYELARAGCPTVAIQVGSDQAGQLQALADAGCVRSIGHVEQGDALLRVREAVVSLLADAPARHALVQAGQRLIDGQGAARVAGALLELQGSHRC